MRLSPRPWIASKSTEKAWLAVLQLGDILCHMAEQRRGSFVRCFALVACTTLVQGQLQFKQTVSELIASGKLQNATQTAAGYTAQTLCSGKGIFSLSLVIAITLRAIPCLSSAEAHHAP